MGVSSSFLRAGKRVRVRRRSRARHEEVDGKFATEWQSSAPDITDGDSSLDWYYGLNNFQYRLVGEKRGDEVVHHVEVPKRYVWGTPSEGKRTVDSGYPAPLDLTVEQADAARLHSVGLA